MHLPLCIIVVVVVLTGSTYTEHLPAVCKSYARCHAELNKNVFSGVGPEVQVVMKQARFVDLDRSACPVYLSRFLVFTSIS